MSHVKWRFLYAPRLFFQLLDNTQDFLPLLSAVALSHIDLSLSGALDAGRTAARSTAELGDAVKGSKSDVIGEIKQLGEVLGVGLANLQGNLTGEIESELPKMSALAARVGQSPSARDGNRSWRFHLGGGLVLVCTVMQFALMAFVVVFL